MEKLDQFHKVFRVMYRRIDAEPREVQQMQALWVRNEREVKSSMLGGESRIWKSSLDTRKGPVAWGVILTKTLT